MNLENIPEQYADSRKLILLAIHHNIHKTISEFFRSLFEIFLRKTNRSTTTIQAAIFSNTLPPIIFFANMESVLFEICPQYLCNFWFSGNLPKVNLDRPTMPNLPRKMRLSSHYTDLVTLYTCQMINSKINFELFSFRFSIFKKLFSKFISIFKQF